MTMQAVTAKNAYVAILGAGAGGNFQVIGYQGQTKSASALKENRLVQAVYSTSSFSKGSNAPTSAKQNDTGIKIIMSVAEDASVDLSTLNSAGSSAGDRATALANLTKAADKASDALDELWEDVFNLTTNAINIELGLTEGTIANLWLDDFQKDEPPEKGGFVIVTASAMLTYRVEEPVLGDSGTTPDNPIYYVDLNVTADPDEVEDPVEETAVQITN